MNKALISPKFSEQIQNDYLSGWNIALQNYHSAMEEFKKIEPRPKSEFKVLRFKKR